MASLRTSPGRIAISFLIGLVIIFPLLNQSGVLTIYEAIAGIWSVFIIPAFFLFRSLSKAGGKRPAMKFTVALYVLGASFYSLVEPLIAGYDLGLYAYLIIVPASLIIMVPSIFVWYRSAHAAEKTNLQIDNELSDSLRSMLAGTDDRPPEVYIRSSGRKIGSRIVTHTDGPNPKIGIYGDAKEKYDKEEISAALLREYFEIRGKSAMRFVVNINLAIMLYVDGIIALSALGRMESANLLGLVLTVLLGVLVFGFIAGFPAILKLMTLRKESGTDIKAAKYLNNVGPLESLIRKGVENYVIPPLATPKRVNRIMATQNKLADRRIKILEALGT